MAAGEKLPPRHVEPELALPVKAPPAGNDWCHELKLDGYRLHARITGDAVQLLTRKGLDWSKRYKAIAGALKKLPTRSAYLDGEICALRPDGTSSFADLQAATDQGTTDRLFYVAFDLLFLDGEELMRKPLEERKRRLETLLKGAPPSIRYMEHVVGNGPAFMTAARKLPVEGIVSKQIKSPYRPGNRGVWRKIKFLNADEFVIVGFTAPGGTRRHVGALLLGYFDRGGKLRYAGRCGSGMSQRELVFLREKLAPLVTETMPLAAPPRTHERFLPPLDLRRIRWVRPELVATVHYLTWTGEGLLRQVSYQGLREDRPARDIVRAGPG